MKKEKLQEKIKELQQEVEKHTEIISKAQEKLKSAKTNLSQEQERQENQVQGTLRDYYKSTSASGLIDKVLQMEMVEPKLAQLRSTITKMESTIDFHTIQRRKDNNTISQLQNKITEIELKEKIKFLKNHFNDFVSIAQGLEVPYRKLTSSLAEVKRLAAQSPGHPQKDYTQILRSNGTDLWMVTILDSILPRLTSNHFAELLLQISLFNDKKNPLYASSLHRARSVQSEGIIAGREPMGSEYGESFVNPAEEAARRLIR